MPPLLFGTSEFPFFFSVTMPRRIQRIELAGVKRYFPGSAGPASVPGGLQGGMSARFIGGQAKTLFRGAGSTRSRRFGAAGKSNQKQRFAGVSWGAVRMEATKRFAGRLSVLVGVDHTEARPRSVSCRE